MNYYNEIEPYAVDWLRNLIAAGLIPRGDVDDRSIRDVQASDLKGYTQAHFFCGIGLWPLALEWAKWPTTRPVFTGSCPCQPYSTAGRGKAEDDPRNLWPEFLRLITECNPATVFGEQTQSQLGRYWLSGVRNNLEALGYGVGAADLSAAVSGSPMARQRLYWVADSPNIGHERGGAARGRGDGSPNGDLGTAHTSGTERRVQEHEALGAAPGSAAELGECPGSVDTGVAAYADLEGLEGHGGLGGYPGELHPSPDDSEIVQNPDSGRGQGEVESPPSDISTSLTGVFQYGDYSQAVRRWELILGRRAPIPVFEGRLNQLFVEWMLGLPLGYGTGLGLSRTQELKLLGNGVVPHQGLLALNLLGQDPVVL